MATPLRVRVIERHRGFLDLLQRTFDAEPDLDCTSATADAASAIAVPGDADAAVLSAHTPGLDVIGGTEELRARFPRARIVVVASYVDEHLVTTATGAGATAVLDLIEPIDHVLDAVRGRPPAVDTSAPISGSARDLHPLALAEAHGLTGRQYEVFRHLASGRSPDQIARALGIKLTTCRDHIKAIHTTLGCASTTQALVAGAHLGLLPQLARPYRHLEHS